MKMDYAILQNEMLPVVLQNKPRWVTCVVCTAALLVMTLSAVTVGAFVGYTYCYVEHRGGYRTGNFQPANFEILGLSSEPKDSKRNVTSVMFTSVLISRLIEIGQSFKNDATHLYTHLKSDIPTVQENATAKCFQK